MDSIPPHVLIAHMGGIDHTTLFALNCVSKDWRDATDSSFVLNMRRDYPLSVAHIVKKTGNTFGAFMRRTNLDVTRLYRLLKSAESTYNSRNGRAPIPYKQALYPMLKNRALWESLILVSDTDQKRTKQMTNLTFSFLRSLKNEIKEKFPKALDKTGTEKLHYYMNVLIINYVCDCCSSSCNSNSSSSTSSAKSYITKLAPDMWKQLENMSGRLLDCTIAAVNRAKEVVPELEGL